jgi:hypothetical protein
MVQLLIQGTSPEEIDDWCKTRLRNRGCIVELRGPWETPKRLYKRLRISASKFRRRWKRYPRPKASDVQLGEKGRIVMIRSNPVLDAFLKAR